MRHLIGTSTAAKILDVSEAAVRQMANRGILKAERVQGGHRVFERESVEQVANQRARARHSAVSPEAA